MKINHPREQLKSLRLSGASRMLEVRLQETSANVLDHGTFLEILLQDELQSRLDHKLRRAVRTAGFQELKPLADFDWQFNPNLERRVFHSLATGDFLSKSQNLLFVGPPGTGKSCLAQAIGYEILKTGRSVVYRSVFDVVAGLQKPCREGGRCPEFYRCVKSDLLIIDDMGMKQLPEKSGELLFEIIFRRHGRKSTLMTSNRPLEDWGKLIADVPMAGAILDRSLQEVLVISSKGRSYRLAAHHGMSSMQDMPVPSTPHVRRAERPILPWGGRHGRHRKTVTALENTFHWRR